MNIDKIVRYKYLGQMTTIAQENNKRTQRKHRLKMPWMAYNKIKEVTIHETSIFI